MAGKNSSLRLKSKLHGAFFVTWTILSTLVYGTVCIILSLFLPHVARKIGRLWNVHLLAVGGVKIKVRGAEKLDKNKRYVFIANHQSALDIPVVYAMVKHGISFIAKKELFFIPIFGWGMAAVGHVWIDRTNARKARNSIIRAVKHLRKSRVSLVLFPEGTRSLDGKISEFKTGSFTLAMQAGVQAVPVVLHDTRLCLPKSVLIVRPGVIHVDICDPLDVNEAEISKAELSNKIRTIICEVVAAGPEKD
jgi:1-acyl-sn-glycerol-3-phosphate acyltransferase